jgi:hypothetical protein
MTGFHPPGDTKKEGVGITRRRKARSGRAEVAISPCHTMHKTDRRVTTLAIIH